MMVALTVLAILMSVGIPAFTDLIEQRRVGGAAEALRAHLQQARHHAIVRGQPVFVSYRPGQADHWGIGYRENEPCNPLLGKTDDPQACTAPQGGQFLGTALEATHWPGVAFRVNRAHTRFEPLSGFAPGSNVSLHLEGRQGRTVRLIINSAGRVRACSPQGEAKVRAYPAC